MGVLGQNDASSGTPIGVQGVVPNATTTGYGLHTPDNAKVGRVLEAGGAQVNGDLVGDSIVTPGTDFTVEVGTTSTNDARNVVHRHAFNEVLTGVVGATISGGGFDDGIHRRAESSPRQLWHYRGRAERRGRLRRQRSHDCPVRDCRRGENNSASGEYATVGGGDSNEASGNGATVGGGTGNSALFGTGVVSGGSGNTANLAGDTVGGGGNNTAAGGESTVSGGSDNTSDGFRASVGGGLNNGASGEHATIPGGQDNTASGDYSFATGRQADTDFNNGAFVGGDSSTTAVTASAADQFVVQAGGGATIYSSSDLWRALGDPSQTPGLTRLPSQRPTTALRPIED